MKKKRHRPTAEELIQRGREVLDRLEREHPEVAFRADDEAFLQADLDEVLAGKDDGAVSWFIGYAMQIATAELRGGEELPDPEFSDIDDDEFWSLYERLDSIASPRLRRAIDVLDRAGYMIPPDFRDDEDDPELPRT